MSGYDTIKVLIRQNNVLRRFMYINLGADGSIYMGHRLKNEKGMNVFYHSSGEVHYKLQKNDQSQFFKQYLEPSPHLTKPRLLLSISLPSIIFQLPEDQEFSDNEVVLTIPDGLDRSWRFDIYLLPWEISITRSKPLVALAYINNVLKIALTYRRIDLSCFEGFNVVDYCIQENKNSELITLDQDQALVDFDQKYYGVREADLMYGPNREGVYRFITAVPMVRASRVKIDFSEPTFTAQTMYRNNCEIRFKVQDQHGNYVKEPVNISSIELDAEL